MNILIAFIPAIFWGVMPITNVKAGGKPINQILGTTMGALMVSLVIFFVTKPGLSAHALLFGVLSGASWAFAQMLQFEAFTEIGVSGAMPISTGLQIIGTSLAGIVLFGEWPKPQTKLIGFLAILIIILGVYLTTISDKKIVHTDKKVDVKKVVLIFVFQIFGYVGYSVFPTLGNLDGKEAFLPQTIGMIGAALLFSLLPGNIKLKPLLDKNTYTNVLSGILFGIAAFGYLLSARANGIATGFTISQMNVVLATLLGVYVLKEDKSKRELIFTLVGLVLVVAGGIITTVMPK